jgi:hypothetical protein
MVGCSEIQWWGDSLAVTVSVGQAMVEAEDTSASVLERAQGQLHSLPAPVDGGGAIPAERDEGNRES